MNNKGMLLASETLKLILSAIGIGFLIFLLTSIYFSTVNSKKLDEATATLDRIALVIEHVQQGEIDFEDVTTLTPAGWSFFSFVEGESKPNSCAGQNCLCICDKITEIKLLGRTQDVECSDDGICLAIPKLRKFETFEIRGAENPTDIEIRQHTGLIEVNRI